MKSIEELGAKVVVAVPTDDNLVMARDKFISRLIGSDAASTCSLKLYRCRKGCPLVWKSHEFQNNFNTINDNTNKTKHGADPDVDPLTRLMMVRMTNFTTSSDAE